MRSAKNKKGSVLVVGGGIAGMQAALDCANSGLKAYLLEEQPAIGGNMAQLDKTFPTNDCSICMLSPKLVEVGRHLNIEIIAYAELEKVQGQAGNFKVTINKRARLVDEEKCTGCGACEEECPFKTLDVFNGELVERKAIYRLYPQAIPNVYTIDQETCKKCKKCSKVCKAEAIDYEMIDKKLQLEVGAIIYAGGYDTFDAAQKPEYGFGRYPNVITSMQFERILSASGPYEGHLERPSDRKVV